MSLSILSSTPRRRKGAFLASAGLHGVTILIVLSVGATPTPTATHRRFGELSLLVAPPRPAKLLPRRRIAVAANPNAAVATPKSKPFVVAPLEQIRIPEPRIEAPPILAEVGAAHLASLVMMPVVSVPGVPVRLDNLSSILVGTMVEKTSKPTIIGGFATSDTLAGNPRRIAGQASSLEPVKSTGLDRPSSSSAASARSRTLRESSFGSSVADTSQKPFQRPPIRSPTREVEILAKPRPRYTDEARRKQVEGDVSVEVLFSKVGEARVLRVIRGLGFGLDEAAIRAAEGIRFRPAENAGLPVDSTATVRIQFQLAF